MSAAVALPRLIRARVWRVEIPALPMLKPLGKPACSSSHAAGSLVWPSEAGQWGMVSAGMLRVAAMASRVDCGDDGVFEEGAGAAAVGFAVDEQHALAVADGADGVVDVDGGGALAARSGG